MAPESIRPSRIRAFFEVRWRLWNERIGNALSYYHNLRFACADILLCMVNGLDNPYRRTRRYFERQKRLPVPYGETPLKTLCEAIQQAGWHRGETIAELGCGVGRTSFWLAMHLRAHVLAIDCQSKFVKRAQWIGWLLRIRRVSFRCGDLRLTDLSSCSAAYFYSTAFPDALLRRITPTLLTLPKGARLITVSQSVLDWEPTAPFRVEKSWKGQFLWGEATLFLQERI
ncbi:MAG: class I SAM-dependent methyltransferase [Chlamydiia bacterium]